MGQNTALRVWFGAHRLLRIAIRTVLLGYAAVLILVLSAWAGVPFDRFGPGIGLSVAAVYEIAVLYILFRYAGGLRGRGRPSDLGR